MTGTKMSENHIRFYNPSAGFNFSEDWYLAGTTSSKTGFMETRYFFRFLPGETWDDLPQGSAEDQRAWLKARETRFYRPDQMEPRKYHLETEIIQQLTLDDFCEVCGVELADLIYTNDFHVREGFQGQGFYLGMPMSEARKLGEDLYRGFAWSIVERGLRFSREGWETPEIWAKGTRINRRRKETFREKRRYRFSRVIDHLTKRVEIKVEPIFD